MADRDKITVRPTDLSGYDVFNVTGPNSNHVTIAIKGKLIEKCRMDDRPRFTISILIFGDFGPWQYFWSHAGGEGETWWDWLEDTDKSYFFGKLCGVVCYEFDLKRTVNAAHKHVEEMWQNEQWEDGVTRECFRQAHYALKDVETEEQFYRVVSELTYKRKVPLRLGGKAVRDTTMFEDYYDMGCTRMKPSLVWFWDNIWRPFIEQAKRTEGFTKPDPLSSTGVPPK